MDAIIQKLLNNEELTAEEWAQVEDIYISNGALRVNLLRAGLYDTVNNYIMNGTNEELKLLWEYSSYININDKNVLSVAEGLNLTYSDLKQLFSTT